MNIRTFKIINKNGVYSITLSGKYTVIIDDSAKGKTRMFDEWSKASKPKFCRYISGIDYLRDFTHLDADVVGIIDDSVISDMSNDDFDTLLHLPQQFLLISRVLPVQLPINYKDVYMFSNSKTYHNMVRLYEDFDKFVYNDKYLCEDSGAGFQYFSKHLDNVHSVFGNSNFKQFATRNSTVIADGAAFAYYVKDLIERCDLFLPVSFEYLVCKHINPRDIRCDLNKVYEHWDGSKYASLEQYYTALLYDFTKHYSQPYTKSKCPDYVLAMDLLEE